MDVPLDLLINAIVAGLLLGGFYAAVTAGIAALAPIGERGEVLRDLAQFIISRES